MLHTHFSSCYRLIHSANSGPREQTCVANNRKLRTILFVNTLACILDGAINNIGSVILLHILQAYYESRWMENYHYSVEIFLRRSTTIRDAFWNHPLPFCILYYFFILIINLIYLIVFLTDLSRIFIAKCWLNKQCTLHIRYV